MASRTLPLLKKPHSIAFEGLVAWLRQDVALRRAVKVWRSWDGKDDDSAPWAADDECGIRLTAEPGPSEPVASDGTNRVWSRPLDVTVETMINNQLVLDDLDLGDAIFARLFPSRDAAENAALEAKLAAWGVMEILETQATTITSESTTEITVSLGKYRLEMFMS